MTKQKFKNKRTDADKRWDQAFIRKLTRDYSERDITALLNAALKARNAGYTLSRSQVRLDMHRG